MAFDPIELMGPRERLAYNINMRPRAAADGAAVPPPSHHAKPSGENYFGEDGLQFSDLVDILNPLQHLPLISMAYRSITGDEISAGARVVGGAIYGGGVGVFVGAIEAAIAEASGGKDLGAIALDAVTGSDKTETVSSASEHKEASITALNDIMPAAGGGETAPTAPSWIYRDAPLAPLAPEPAPTPALASPAIQQSAAPLLPIGPMPIPSTPESQLDSMPELSQDQISLLLQSVGLDPKTGASMPNSATAPRSDGRHSAANTDGAFEHTARPRDCAFWARPDEAKRRASSPGDRSRLSHAGGTDDTSARDTGGHDRDHRERWRPLRRDGERPRQIQTW